jgi:hypothetical protein
MKLMALKDYDFPYPEKTGKEIVDRSPNCSFDTYKSDSIIHDIIKYLDKDRSVRDHTEGR